MWLCHLQVGLCILIVLVTAGGTFFPTQDYNSVLGPNLLTSFIALT